MFEPIGTAEVKINTVILSLNDHLHTATLLGDNYPNPFNGETTIPYVIGEQTTVDISIYDMIGQKLNTLVHGSLQPGSYKTVWKANDNNSNRVNPGIYFCKMFAGDKAFVKLMIVQ